MAIAEDVEFAARAIEMQTKGEANPAMLRALLSREWPFNRLDGFFAPCAFDNEADAARNWAPVIKDSLMRSSAIR